ACRCHVVLLAELRSGVQLGEPAQRSQAGGEAVLTAAGDDERRQVLKPAPDRHLGNREAAGSVVRPDQRVLLKWRADEDAVVQPLGLRERELALEVRARDDEDYAAV